MSQRTVRVNELLRLEISETLHRRWQSESARITVTCVEISSDLREARVFYSVIGDAEERAAARRLFERVGKTLRMEVARRVILKYTPAYRFVEDKGAAAGASVIDLLDRVAAEDAARDKKHGNSSSAAAPEA